jgi:hypothetical protein
VRAPALVLLATVVAAAGACRTLDPVTVPVEMPGVAAFPPGAFSEIVLTEFRNEAPIPGFDVGRELQAYLGGELKRAFAGSVSLRPLVDPAAAGPAYWKDAAGGRAGVIFIAGSVKLTSEVRKALKSGLVPRDGPFDVKRTIIEQLRWTLVVEISVVSGSTGQPIYDNVFREDRDYIDLERPAEFALSDASAAVRGRFFQALLGTPTIEKRTLLLR